MKTNLAQHQCVGKCSVFTAEQDFLTGDVVVLKTLETLCITDLMTLKDFDGCFWLTDHQIGRLHADVIRTATVAELKAKRRLMEASL